MYLIEFVLNAAGFQSQFRVLVLLHPSDDLYHLMVVLGSDLTNLSKVDVVRDEVFINTIPQQRHNLVDVPKKGQKLQLSITGRTFWSETSLFVKPHPSYYPCQALH